MKNWTGRNLTLRSSVDNHAVCLNELCLSPGVSKSCRLTRRRRAVPRVVSSSSEVPGRDKFRIWNPARGPMSWGSKVA